MDFSVCILTDNWHDRLPELIASFQSSANEILLGANGNFTREDHAELKAFPNLKIIALPWQGYGATKNALASLAKNDWIFSVDSDEMADPALQRSLAAINIADTQTVAAVRRLNFLGNRPVHHGSWGKKKLFIRFYNRKFTAWNTDPVHEAILEMKGMKIHPLKGMLLHYTAADIAEVGRKSRHYAALASEYRQRYGRSAPVWKKWLSPLFTFCKEYFFQLGFLDGETGFRIARINAQYTYLKYKGAPK